jgi:hypothetical protein
MRVEANLDQKALAVKLNVPFSEIKDAEAGKEIKLKHIMQSVNMLNNFIL